MSTKKGCGLTLRNTSKMSVRRVFILHETGLKPVSRKDFNFLSIALAGQVKIKIVLSWHVFLFARSFFNNYVT